MATLEHLQTENNELKAKIAALEGSLAKVTRERDELFGAILQMPALIVLFRGREQTFALANEPWLNSCGKRDVVGKTIREAMPEVDGQGFFELLDQVFMTGETFVGTAMPVDIVQYDTGKLERRWFTFHYIQHRGVEGEPLGVIVHATDVSAEHQTRKEVLSLNLKLHTFFALAENAPDGISVLIDGRITYANKAFARMVGCETDGCVGMDQAQLVAAESAAALVASELIVAREGTWRGTLTFARSDGSTFVGELSRFAIRDEEGGQATGCIVRDLTEQRRMEQEREALREQVIAAQDRAIRELSSPLIPLAKGLVVMPLVGTIDSARSARLMETLLHGISAQRAKIAILDVTGARNVDGEVANALLRAARAAGLLGTEVILTGIGPEVAQTLVQVGAGLEAVKTRGTLESAVAYAMSTGALGPRR